MYKRYDVSSKEFQEILATFTGDKKAFSDDDLSRLLQMGKPVGFKIQEIAVYKGTKSFENPEILSVMLKDPESDLVAEYNYINQSPVSYQLKSIQVKGTEPANLNLVLINIARAEKAVELFGMGTDFKILGADVPEDAIGMGLEESSILNQESHINNYFSNCLKDSNWRNNLFKTIGVNTEQWNFQRYFDTIKAQSKSRISLFIVGTNPSRSDAFNWMLKLMTDAKLSYHPDDPAKQYINMTTKKQALTDDECNALDNSNRILLKKFGNETYKIGVEAQHKYEELRKQ